jgi:hypothetical protein
MLWSESELILRIRQQVWRGPEQYHLDKAMYQRWYPAQDPSQRAIEQRSFVLPNPALSLAQLDRAASALGFPIPRLLQRLYTEVADGGFGPEYGLYGLLHPHQTNVQQQ